MMSSSFFIGTEQHTIERLRIADLGKLWIIRDCHGNHWNSRRTHARMCHRFHLASEANDSTDLLRTTRKASESHERSDDRGHHR